MRLDGDAGARRNILLPVAQKGSAVPALVLLHFFGGSQREWTEAAEILADQHQCIAVDLPGFGDARNITGYTVKEMAIQVAETLDSLRLSSFVLVGHSMSGKVCLALAAQKLAGLQGLVLVAPSPPSPEPIEEKNRKKMLALPRDGKGAATFLDEITAKPLTGEIRERAIQDFIRTSPDAWAAWLEAGSKEDWSNRVGVVNYPALVITGEMDPSLPASVQEQSTLPHLSRARLEIIPKCGHLPTMEAPDKLSSLICAFMLDELGHRREEDDVVPS